MASDFSVFCCELLFIKNLRTAVSTIETLYRENPKYSLIAQALYLQAISYELLQQLTEASSSWRTLSQIAPTNSNYIYIAHALIALGDNRFSESDFPQSMVYFKKAKSILEPHEKTSSYESTRVYYRILWAAQRLNDSDTMTAMGIKLLNANLVVRNLDQREKIQSDATEILTDLLFEQDSFKLTSKTLTEPSIKKNAPNVGHKLATKLLSVNAFGRVLELNSLLIQEFPFSHYLPEWAMIRNTHAHAPRGVLSAYRDNAAVIEGVSCGERWYVDPQSGIYASVAEPIDILMKVEGPRLATSRYENLAICSQRIPRWC